MGQLDLGLANDKIVSVNRTSGTGAPGTIDTYTITLRSGDTYTFNVTNGSNGGGVNKIEFTSSSSPSLLNWCKTNTNYKKILCAVLVTGSSTTKNEFFLNFYGKFLGVDDPTSLHMYFETVETADNYSFTDTPPVNTTVKLYYFDENYVPGEGMENPMTTAGDLIRGGASGTPSRLAKGTDGQVLKMVSGLPEWSNETGGMSNPMNSSGDIIVGGSSGTPTRLGKGNAGQVLKVNSGGTGLEWGNETGGMSNPMTATGDIIVGGTSGTPNRLAKGLQGQVLKVGSSGLPEWANESGGGGGSADIGINPSVSPKVEYPTLLTTFRNGVYYYQTGIIDATSFTSSSTADDLMYAFEHNGYDTTEGVRALVYFPHYLGTKYFNICTVYIEQTLQHYYDIKIENEDYIYFDDNVNGQDTLVSLTTRPKVPGTLWTNSNPTNSFAGQTITIDSASEYNYIVVEWASDTNSSYTGGKKITKFQKGSFTNSDSISLSYVTDDHFVYQRDLKMISDTQITFYGAREYDMGNDSSTNANDHIIPFKIYGTNNL